MASGGRVSLILTRNGIADAGQGAVLASLKKRLDAPGAKVLLHLHGGLVDQAAGTAGAQRLSGATPDSWQLKPDWTQIYVVWRTGAIETLKTNWSDLVHDDRLYQTILRKLIGFVGRRLGIPTPGGMRSASTQFKLSDREIQRLITGKGDRRDPFAALEVHLAPELPPGSRASVMVPQSDPELALQFQAELTADQQFQAALADVEGVVNAGLPGRTALPPAKRERGAKSLAHLAGPVQASIEAAGTRSGGGRGVVSVGAIVLKHAGLIAARVFKRFRTQRDHGFHATLVEEVCRELYGDLIGAKVWGMMVNDAADHFTGGGFGITLLDMLRAAPPERLVVSAHSAGSIWASRMLLALAERKQQARMRLVLLAPAVRHDLFAKALAAGQDQIELCRMFTMCDELERKDAVLGHDRGYIYPSSLLYCVSGMFEERGAKAYPDAPLVGMRRFAAAPWLDAGESADVGVVSQFFTRPKNGIVTSPTPGVCMADCHGCFDDEVFTLKSAAALF